MADVDETDHDSRIAHAVRGLKWYCNFEEGVTVSSHRSCGAWIEMIVIFSSSVGALSSHRSCGAWIEIELVATKDRATLSHRSSGAWIEIDINLVLLIV